MADNSISPTRPASPPAAGIHGKAAAKSEPSGKSKEKKADEPRDVFREIAETVVFVVVLVLMLKTFVAEAFVIPTGSMAETLYGYHKMVACDRCKFVFPVNCSSEVDPQDGNPRPVLGCRCPNCQHAMKWPTLADAPSWNSGDRVLVAKFLFDDNHLWAPHRHEVFVFKYPEAPQKAHTAMNYIKRVEGESEETVAIFGGDLYATKSLKHPLPEGDPKDYWRPANMFPNDDAAVLLFKESLKRRVANKATADDFEIIRKPPKMILDVRRPVYDNDFQADDLAGKAAFRRWQYSNEKGRWSVDDPKAAKVFTHAGDAADATEEWLDYRHLLREDARQGTIANPEEFANDPRRLIANMMGYNTGDSDHNQEQFGTHWVGDLMLDCRVKVTNPQGELVLELAKCIDRFQARFDLATGDCSLVRLTGKIGEKHESQVLAQKATKLKSSGTYHLRFANFDERLTVWVDSALPFGDGVAYSPAAERGPVAANDLLPARIGAMKSGVAISQLQLWRDGYYTANTNLPVRTAIEMESGKSEAILTLYVQPGHYLALGDNSGASSDSRYWGVVPQRLLLGRALGVYFPFWPFSDPTRFGAIR